MMRRYKCIFDALSLGVGVHSDALRFQLFDRAGLKKGFGVAVPASQHDWSDECGVWIARSQCILQLRVQIVD